MALAPKRSDAAANAACNAMAALCTNGYLRIYSTPKPATANDAATGTLLAELRMHATAAFGNAAAGVATADTITADSDASATGTAVWFRVLGAGGTDVTDTVYDGSVGTGSGYDLLLNTTSIVQHASVSVTALTLTETE